MNPLLFLGLDKALNSGTFDLAPKDGGEVVLRANVLGVRVAIATLSRAEVESFYKAAHQ